MGIGILYNTSDRICHRRSQAEKLYLKMMVSSAAVTFLSKCAHLLLVHREMSTRTLKYGKIFAISCVFIIENLPTNTAFHQKKKKKSVTHREQHPGQNRKWADSPVNPKQPPRSVCQQSQPWCQPKKSATNPDTAAGKTHSRSYTPLPSPPHDYSHGLWRTQRKKVKRNRINIAYSGKRQCQGNAKFTGKCHFTLFLHYFNADFVYCLSRFNRDLVTFGRKPSFLSKHDNGLTLCGLMPQRFANCFTNSSWYVANVHSDLFIHHWNVLSL